jgi:glycine cleavage system aminomethyltransferase T
MTGALAFLSTGDTLAVSPLASGTAAAGATFEARDGWEVAVRCADPGVEALARRQAVAWADVSHLPKYELQGPAAALDALDPLPAAGDGLAVRDGDGAWWCRATPTRALVLGRAAAPDAGSSVSLLDVTSQLGALRVAGPLGRELFARFCALDLRPQATPPGAFRPGSVARTPGYVLCEAPDRWLMLFGSAYGAYVWELVSDAGMHLGGRPVGVDALAAATAEEPTHA